MDGLFKNEIFKSKLVVSENMKDGLFRTLQCWFAPQLPNRVSLEYVN